MDGALFFEEVTFVPTVDSILDGARGLLFQTCGTEFLRSVFMVCVYGLCLFFDDHIDGLFHFFCLFLHTVFWMLQAIF